MVLSLLAVGGALSITLSCVAAVGALSTAVRIAEAPIVFLEKKPETPQAFKFQGMAPERPFLRPLEGSSGVPFKVPASEEWMEDKAMHAGHLGELAEGQQQRQQLPRSSSTHALHGGRGSSLEPGLERHEAFIVSSAGSRAVDIGRLRDVPLQELGLSSALLLRPRTDEEHLFRVKDAARNLQTGETLLYLSRGQILLLKQEIGLLLSPEGFVLAAWELPQPFTEGHSRALSLQQLQHRYETEATAAASASSFVSSGSSGDSLKETAEVLGQAEGMMSPSFPNTHRPTPPPPSSPLEFALLDLGEPLLSGFPEESPTKPVHKGQPAVLGPPKATERSGPSQGTGATPFFVAGGPPVMRPEGFQNAES